MYTIIETILSGQDGNGIPTRKYIEGFKTVKDAQTYIDEKCEQNGWHSYEIVYQPVKK